MTIEIHQPELEALIHERMQTGAFASIEDVLLQALRGSASPKPLSNGVTGLTGAVIVAAMQACPYPDFDFEIERFPMTIRDPEFDPLAARHQRFIRVAQAAARASSKGFCQ